MPLARSLIEPPGERGEALVLVLHGILGSRSNFRSTARRVVGRCPRLGAVLVDLRQHGESQGFAAPHTLRAAAADLRALEATLDRPVRAIMGHSFGGKVALAWAAEAPRAPAHVVVLDAMPGARPGGRGSEGTLGTVALLRRLPKTWGSREEFVERLAGEGVARELGAWLAMNLERRVEGGHALALDLDAIDALLDDYFATDLWPVVEAPREGTTYHLVVAGRSTVFDPDDLARAARAAEHPRVHLHVLEGAGHWLHVDARVEVVEIVARALCPSA